jgi:hypothetical protein
VQFLGIVIFCEAEKNRIFLYCKNPLSENQEIEILGKTENFWLVVKDLQNAVGEKILLARSNSVASFACEKHLLSVLTAGHVARCHRQAEPLQKVV